MMRARGNCLHRKVHVLLSQGSVGAGCVASAVDEQMSVEAEVVSAVVTGWVVTSHGSELFVELKAIKYLAVCVV